MQPSVSLQSDGQVITGRAVHSPWAVHLDSITFLVTLSQSRGLGPQSASVFSCRQAPLPSQRFLQESSLHLPLGSGAPAATLVQVPCMPGIAQDLQMPVQALLQQTPSTQLPLEQSAPLPHLPPFSRLPQEPALQTVPPAHWVSLPQVPRQLLPLQPLKGAQLRVPDAGQVPLLHLAAIVPTLLAASHLAPRQVVLLSYLAQAPLPSHLPLVPQVLAAWTGQPESATPAAVGTHLPRVAGFEQLWQAPVQALSQQTPSTQKALSHSEFMVQVWPGPNLPQLPARQVLPATH